MHVLVLVLRRAIDDLDLVVVHQNAPGHRALALTVVLGRTEHREHTTKQSKTTTERLEMIYMNIYEFTRFPFSAILASSNAATKQQIEKKYIKNSPSALGQGHSIGVRLVGTNDVRQVVGSQEVVDGLSTKTHRPATTGRVTKTILVQSVCFKLNRAELETNNKHKFRYVGNMREWITQNTSHKFEFGEKQHN